MTVAFDDKLSVLINKYNINDLHSFAQFIKSKFMFMHGHSQFYIVNIPIIEISKML